MLTPDDLPKTPEERAEDYRLAWRMAADTEDRYRDVVTQCLGLPEFPGDDNLIAALLAAHGLAGQPESTRWRDFVGTTEIELREAGFQLPQDPPDAGQGET